MLKLTMVPREELHDDRRASVSSPRYDEHLDVLSVMLNQEDTYASIDYLSVIRSKQQKDQEKNPKSTSYKGGKDLPPKLVDEFCRDQIVEWKYRVMDYFKVDREIISISMNYLDRYLGIVPLCDRRTFKRAATAALHLAIKVHQPDKMRMIGVLSDLSRGEFEMADIAEFESVISEGLNWRLHPPTSICLVTRLMSVIPMIPSTPILEDDEMATCLLDFSLFFAELSVCDYSLAVMQKSSTVAIASLFNAMEGLGLLSSAAASSSYLRDFGELIGRSSELDMEALAFTKERLWNLYENSEEFSLTHDQDSYVGGSAAVDPSTPTRDSPSNGTDAKAVSDVSDSSSPICVSRHVRAAAAVLA
mmetsp:Transcript_15378/g.33439  ORF Transcript_15378/g.33439 Transcript_15378/m.33439 type:complete len:361 (-) Transcript_15378:341-1423(-)